MDDKLEVKSNKLMFFNWGLVVLNFVVGISVYKYLPAMVPIHWNIRGEVDGYGGPAMGAFALPAVHLFLMGLMVLLPRIDPRKENYQKMTKPYWIMITSMSLFFTLLYWATLAIAFGYKLDMGQLIMVGMGILFAVMGNYFGKLKHNYFMGIKTPWTLASEEVWNRTHRMAGPMWVIGGVLMVVVALVAGKYCMPIDLGITFTVAIIPIIYSYFIFQKLKNS